jgi:hypothetical protein
VVSAARFALIALLAAPATFSPTARAGSPPQASAAELLDSQATSLMQEHRYAEACPKLAESDRIKPGTGVLLRLALCYELSGRTASAWSAFREAAGRARRAGDASLADLASRRADGLEPRLAKLVVRLPPDEDPAQVDVRLDGAPFAQSAFGVDVPIDPGTHTLQAAAAGRRPFATTFAIADRGGTTAIAIDLARVASDGGGATQRTAAITAGAIGVAGVVVGSILGIAAMSNWNRARSGCTSGTSGCSQDALNLQPVVNGEALGATIAFSVGAVGIAGAALLWFTAPSPARGRRAAYVVSPSADGRRFGLSLTGSF